MSYDPLTIGLICIGAFALILIGWIIRLEIKIHRLLKGSDGTSLEHTILDAHKKIEMLSEFRKDSLSYFGDVEKRLSRSIQAIETVRFNPFKGTGDGGNQSFSTALLSEKGDGVVLSSMYSRDRVSIFSKPLKKYESEFELTEEEKEVLDNAKKYVAQ